MVNQFIGLTLFSLGIIGLLTVKTFGNNKTFKNIWWPKQDLNLHFNNYESFALTN